MILSQFASRTAAKAPSPWQVILKKKKPRLWGLGINIEEYRVPR